MRINAIIKELVFHLRTSDVTFFLLFSIMAGVGAGFSAIVFRWLIAQFKDLFFEQGQNVLYFLGHYYVILVPAIGGLIIGPLIYFLAREAKGHGVPEVISANAVSGGKIRLRVVFIKALASSLCIGSGGSVGREGPIVQISSAVGSGLGQLLKLSEQKLKILVACGAAGGIAATFNAPLGGIFFALEVILREYGLRYFSSVVLSSVTATVISRHFLGNHPAFVTPAYQLLGFSEIPHYFVLGLLAAFIAFFFIKILYKCEDGFAYLKIPDYTKPALGGLIIGLIGFFFPQIFGVGYQPMEQVLFGEVAFGMVIILIFLKILATSVTLGSGGSGGIFAPSLFIGAFLGEAYGQSMHLLFPDMIIPRGAFALVGMAAVFAGTAQAPISAILLLFEMTGNYKILLPLMISCVISTLVIRRFTKHSIYTLKLIRRGIDIDKYKAVDLMDTIRVSEAMIEKIITAKESSTIQNVGLMIKTTNHRGFPVLDSKDNLVGIVTRKDINRALARKMGDISVKEIMTRDIIVCYPDENLRTALQKLAKKNIGRIPVVERDNPNHIKGLITRKSLITGYNRALQKREKALES